MDFTMSLTFANSGGGSLGIWPIEESVGGGGNFRNDMVDTIAPGE
jgi:hypothetical protein